VRNKLFIYKWMKKKEVILVASVTFGYWKKIYEVLLSEE